MKITKYNHSCLLLELSDLTILVDPGEFSWGERLELGLKELDKLDYLLLTHQHADHTFIPAIKQILAQFPDVKIVCGPAVQKILLEQSINPSTENTDSIKLFIGKHQPLYEGVPESENTQFLVKDKLLIMGDSMHPAAQAEIMAVPFFGPWLEGTFSNAINMILEYKPKFVIPVHDWHYNDQARTSFCSRAKDYFSDKGVEIFEPVDGVSFKVNGGDN